MAKKQPAGNSRSNQIKSKTKKQEASTKKPEAKKAISSAIPLPTNSIVYCLGYTKEIAACLPSGEVVIMAGPGLDSTPDSPFNDKRFSPYGITWDSLKRGFWVSDKFHGRLWFLVFRDANSPSLEAIESIHHEYLRSPCTVDFSQKGGLLVGCFGSCELGGSVVRFHDGDWSQLTPQDLHHSVSHVCWLGQTAYCFVTRHDSVLWYAKDVEAEPLPITSPRSRCIPQASGRTEDLRLRYAHGLAYSSRENSLYVADASLGAIYRIDINNMTYGLYSGKPSHCTNRTRCVHEGNPTEAWLGQICGLTLIDGRVPVIIESQSRSLLACDGTVRLQMLGKAFPRGRNSVLSGTGLVAIHP